MRTAALILAAGASRRFGSPKHEVRIGGRRMIEHVTAAAREAGLGPILAVVPPGLAVGEGVGAVVNDRPEDGISRSIRLGVAALPAEADAVVILLGDEPFLHVDDLRDIVAAGEEGAPVVAARAADRLGPPVLLRRERFGLVDRLEGDRGLNRVLAATPGLVTVSLGRAPVDVDTPADLEAIAPACPGCGARVPAPPATTTHAYIGASPGCWLRWTELNRGGQAGRGRPANDAYAAQHPGVDGRRQRQSVAMHLIALCHWLEHGIEEPDLTELTRAALAGRTDWPWLAPPASYALTVHDLPVPISAEDARRWAQAVWHAWSAHHETVRAWAGEVLP